MKWSLQQLRKINNFPYAFEAIINFNESIYQDILKSRDDIYKLNDVNVKGNLVRIDEETYEVNYTMTTTVVMACSLTLEDVIYEVNESFQEIYSTKANDDWFLIEKNTIDLDEMVWSNLIMSLPIRIVRSDAYEILKSRGITLEQEVEE